MMKSTLGLLCAAWAWKGSPKARAAIEEFRRNRRRLMDADDSFSLMVVVLAPCVRGHELFLSTKRRPISHNKADSAMRSRGPLFGLLAAFYWASARRPPALLPDSRPHSPRVWILQRQHIRICSNLTSQNLDSIRVRFARRRIGWIERCSRAALAKPAWGLPFAPSAPPWERKRIRRTCRSEAMPGA
ncbi:MAG: hypothetical protein BWZ10_03312 [candidate division BRC1 bacterium ADurb.BinA364]|nr:MAG: hypothetical protein BWZ10_03312 [candidate division BRC1 bacterium ADurb.BinA364]